MSLVTRGYARIPKNPPFYAQKPTILAPSALAIRSASEPTASSLLYILCSVYTL